MRQERSRPGGQAGMPRLTGWSWVSRARVAWLGWDVPRLAGRIIDEQEWMELSEVWSQDGLV
jgi:hypothetical protein